MHYMQRRQNYTITCNTMQNSTSRPNSRLLKASPPRNKGVTFMIKPIRIRHTSNNRSDKKMDSGRCTKFISVNPQNEKRKGNHCSHFSLAHKPKVNNLMIKSDEPVLNEGKHFAKYRVKQGNTTMKTSPVCLRKPRLEDNMFNFKNSKERQVSNGCQTQKNLDRRSTIGSYNYQQTLLKNKKEPAKMFKVRKQHFTNLKLKFEEMLGGEANDMYTKDGQNTMSRQVNIPTKTISLNHDNDAMSLSPSTTNMSSSPVNQTSPLKQFITTKKFNNYVIAPPTATCENAECQDFKTERESKIERALLIRKQNKILNDMYQGGQMCHQNEIVFLKDDVILPVDQEQLDDIEIDLIMNVKCPSHAHNECQKNGKQ